MYTVTHRLNVRPIGNSVNDQQLPPGTHQSSSESEISESSAECVNNGDLVTSKFNRLRTIITKLFSWFPSVLKSILSRMSRLGEIIHHLLETPVSTLRFVQQNVALKPVAFHEKHGRNIRVWIDRYIALRAYNFDHGYVFLPKSVKGKGFFVVVQVLEIDKNHLGSLAFGVTTKDPSDIPTESLPSNAQLLDDGRSCLVYRNVARRTTVGDVLLFYVNERNHVCVKVNENAEEILFPIRKDLSYWWFFDVYGSTRKIRAYVAEQSEVNSLGIAVQQPEFDIDCTDWTSAAKLSAEEADNSAEPTLTLRCDLTRMGILYKPITTSLLKSDPRNTAIEDPSIGYCTECFRNPNTDCMLYPCSHFILCYDCAVNLKQSAEFAKCPKCYSIIENAMRVFRP